MSPRKDRLEEEREIAAHFQAHKDEGEWEPVKVTRPARAGMVYSVRFTGPELDSLRGIASREGKHISDLVHEALATYLAIKSQKERPFIVNTDFSRRRMVAYRSALATPVAGSKQKVIFRVNADTPVTAVI